MVRVGTVEVDKLAGREFGLKKRILKENNGKRKRTEKLVGLREKGRKLERKKAASYLLASHLILSASIFIRLELSMEDHVYKECLKSSKV